MLKRNSSKIANRITLSKEDAITQLLELQKTVLQNCITEKSNHSNATNTQIMTHIDNLVSLLNCCNIEKVCFFCFSSDDKEIKEVCKEDTIALYFPGGYSFWREFIGII